MSEEEHGGEDSSNDPPTTPMNADSVGIPNWSDETIKKLIPQLIPKSTDTSPGAFAPLPDLEQMQNLFPRLEVLELLGAGGMGAVFKARQKKLDRMVAVKILNQGLSGDPEFIARFEREARAMARLDHPNIVTIYDFGEREGFYFFIMEYVDGGDLRKLIQQKKAAPAVVLDLIPQICEAVQFAHDEGITHRDIKPANILLDQKGRVKVADFGLAKIVEGDADSFQTMAGAGMGTPFYMAPEQMTDADTVDQRADIYSLGVVIYQLITGNLPQGDFPLPSKSVPEISTRMDNAIMRAMAQDPDLRFSEVKDLFEALEIVRGGRKSQTPNKARGRGGLIAGLAVALIVALAGAAFWLKPWEKSGVETVEASAAPPEKKQMELTFRGIDHPDMVNGRLRGVGNVPDLEKFAEYDDIVQVGTQWRFGPPVCLRANGEMITRFGTSFEENGAARISQNLGHNPFCLDSSGRALGTAAGNFRWETGDHRCVDLLNVVHDQKSLGAFGLLKEGKVAQFGLHDWKPIPDDEFGNIGQIVASSGLFAAISGGRVFAWNAEGLIDLPEKFLRNIKQIGISDVSLFALDFDAKCHVIARDGSPKNLPWLAHEKIKQLSSRGLSPMYQKVDGNWHFFHRSPGAELLAALPKIKDHPPEAFSVSEYGEGNPSYMFWIEPVVGRSQSDSLSKAASEKEKTFQKSPGMLLQTESDLAFRGIGHPDMIKGRLRGVGNVPDLEKFAAYDDIVQVGSQYRQGPLVILRSGGQVFSGKGKIYSENVARISQFHGVNPAFLYSDGSVLSNSVSGFPVPDAERAFVEVYCLKGGGDVVGGLGLLKDGSVQPFGLSDWREFPSRMLSDVSRVVLVSDFSAVLSGGKVSAWGPDGEVPLSAAFKQNIVDIAMSDWQLYGLDGEGNCFVANGEGQQTKLPWQNKGDVIALSSRCGTPLHQTKDGNWHFTEDKAGAELKLALPNLKGLPPEAFFVGDFEDKEYLVWIEQEEKRGNSEPELAAPKMDLPLALAAMKQRGGRIKGISIENGKRTDLASKLESARGIDDFTEVKTANWWWRAKRANGDMVAMNSDAAGMEMEWYSKDSDSHRMLESIADEVVKAVHNPVCTAVLTKDGAIRMFDIDPTDKYDCENSSIAKELNNSRDFVDFVLVEKSG
ncbi:MAG: serine/threonine-protein kinase [Verrucomicrobiales bacterium]|nr:serine/threonine-protein kinase [Verrucomicrobiales bacterium]